MNKSYIVDSSYKGTRIDKWIRNKLGQVPQGLIEKNLRKGKIKLNQNSELTLIEYNIGEKSKFIKNTFELYNLPSTRVPI